MVAFRKKNQGNISSKAIIFGVIERRGSGKHETQVNGN